VEWTGFNLVDSVYEDVVEVCWGEGGAGGSGVGVGVGGRRGGGWEED
jgi:hypothetical protein